MPEIPVSYIDASKDFFRRRRKELLILAGIAVIASGGISTEMAGGNQGKATDKYIHLVKGDETGQTSKLLDQVGQSLIDKAETSRGGWRFRSSIQAPHYQVDRDVGAASVGEGFLALYAAEPHNKEWINGAEKTAAWLIAVSSQDGNGGRYWHDYVDDNAVSPDVYTSFDDGAIGIGDFFWQLYEKTGKTEYRQIAIESVNWTLSQAEVYKKDGLSGYRWKWDVTDPSSPYYMGMGEGAAGITYALAQYSVRLKHTDPVLANRCKNYMEGSLRYIDIVRKELAKNIGTSRTIPETGVVGRNGGTELDSGYVSGAAGDAYMYLSLYRTLGDKKYLSDAIEILDWLSDTKHGPMVKVGGNAVAWRLALDPEGGNNNHYATGVEEGNAGIGWVYLQAAKLMKNENKKKSEQYETIAKMAGNWLDHVAIKNNHGRILSWREDQHPKSRLIHANLDNGAAGIGVFLKDVGDKKGAQGALNWLMATARHKGRDIYWNDNGGSDSYSNDPSYHWGLAGDAEFGATIKNSSANTPTEQPGL